MLTVSMGFFFFTIIFSFSNYIIPVHAVFNPITKPIISYCCGSNHACAVFDTNQVKCWGYASFIGTLTGYGASASTVGDNIPYFNPGSSVSVTKVTCSDGGTCFLLNTGDVKCVGLNNVGQIGIGLPTTTSPIGASSGHVGDTLPTVLLGSGVVVTSIAGGWSHTCALTSTGQVKCYGRNQVGQLGYGDTTDRGSDSSFMGNSLAFVSLGSSVTAVSIHSSSSSFHNCVILSAPIASVQRIKCWGLNNFGQLGYGNTNYRGDQTNEMGDSLPLVDLGTESRVNFLTLGMYHSCAVLINDVFKCWGSGIYGQLGSGSNATIMATGDSLPSVLIDSGKIVKLLSNGWHHICIVYDDYLTLKCFGYDYNGHLGQGDRLDRGNTPTTMIPLIPAIQLGTGSLKISSLFSGANFNCLIFNDNSVKCFGDCYNGQCANGASGWLGYTPGQMGSNLQFAELFSPTKSPTPPTQSPTKAPTKSPTLSPTKKPTKNPTPPTLSPTKAPTSTPTSSPTKPPSLPPTRSPSKSPTQIPTLSPSQSPSISPTAAPTLSPTTVPTMSPSVTPTISPTSSPSVSPSLSPSASPTSDPTSAPTKSPSMTPTTNPTLAPTITPTKKPTTGPTTSLPTALPSVHPTSSPTRQCDYQSAKLCKYDYNCMWMNVDGIRRCALFNCAVLNKGKCGKQRTKCKWNKKENTCTSTTK